MSQETLGAAAGVSFQQVHKYESGCPGVPASCLFEFAKALDVPPSFFFESPRLRAKVPLYKRESLELLHALSIPRTSSGLA